MAALTTAWNEAKPAGTDAKSDGDNQIRTFKIQMREAWQIDHNFPSTGSAGDATMGYHKAIHLKNEASDPTAVADMCLLYTKDVSSKSEVHIRDEDGDVMQLTSGGKFGVTVLNPVGAVWCWAGTIAAIPTGWVICDGNNGSPNLLSRAILCVETASTEHAAVSASNALAVAHTHTGPSHTHTHSAHSHDIKLDQIDQDPGAFFFTGSSGTAVTQGTDWVQNTTTTESAAGTGASGSTGSETYYGLVFIYKT